MQQKFAHYCRKSEEYHWIFKGHFKALLSFLVASDCVTAIHQSKTFCKLLLDFLPLTHFLCPRQRFCPYFCEIQLNFLGSFFIFGQWVGIMLPASQRRFYFLRLGKNVRKTFAKFRDLFGFFFVNSCIRINSGRRFCINRKCTCILRYKKVS